MFENWYSGGEDEIGWMGNLKPQRRIESVASMTKNGLVDVRADKW